MFSDSRVVFDRIGIHEYTNRSFLHRIARGSEFRMVYKTASSMPREREREKEMLSHYHTYAEYLHKRTISTQTVIDKSCTKVQ